MVTFALVFRFSTRLLENAFLVRNQFRISTLWPDMRRLNPAAWCGSGASSPGSHGV
jgi:hypothetical protein